MHLTKKQKLIFDFIKHAIQRDGYAPSIHEIGEHFGLSSPATIHKHLTNLEEKGLIRRAPNMSRGMELLGSEPHVAGVEVPLLGTIAAGRPIEAFSVEETISIPEDMLGRNGTYVLKVKGESMIEEQIRDGDFVVIEERNHAVNGETVVALVDGDSVTLKKYYRQNERIRLQPANANMEPIIVPEENVSIQGVVIGLLRKF